MYLRDMHVRPRQQMAASSNRSERSGYLLEGLALVLALGLLLDAVWPAPSPVAQTSPGAQMHHTPSKSDALAARSGVRPWPSPAPWPEMFSRLALDDAGLQSGDLGEMRQQLDWLGLQGTGALPAIRDQLQSGQDIDFHALGVAREMGFDSLRMALFDALYRIGDTQAEVILRLALEQSLVPGEIAALGRYLEELAPGHYQDEILQQVRLAFSLADEQGLDGQDVGPLFLALVRHGDERALVELEQVNPRWWGNYAAVTLANLPGGVGLPNLVNQSLIGPLRNVRAQLALQLLAQQAEHSEAQWALLAHVGSDQILDRDWPEFARLLAGTYRIQLERPRDQPDPVQSTTQMTAFTPGGGQTLYGVHYRQSSLGQEQLAPRLELIAALYEVTDNPVARRELARAYETLSTLYMAAPSY
ncbi:hypothetical protein [Zobellella sp. DQSA1]|uniref:hypothetical protein n=1 Tax=Zobellella sp. DQSA1 TaxID=3342386 RepID=UPI0035BF16B2